MSSRGAPKTALVSAIRNVHFSSVLMLHRSSKTIHVDDTVMYIRLPKMLRFARIEGLDELSSRTRQGAGEAAGAAADFRDWAEELIERWRDAQNLCAAHTATLTSRQNNGASIHARLVKALAKVEGTLTAHQRKRG